MYYRMYHTVTVPYVDIYMNFYSLVKIFGKFSKRFRVSQIDQPINFTSHIVAMVTITHEE